MVSMKNLEDVSMAMSSRMKTSMSHISTLEDATTINYTLDWPYLENPSNTTFAGLTQLDVCRCQRVDLPPQKDTEPGHVYTRFKCAGPEIRFKTEREALWVLETPKGPINVLRPATNEEQSRRQELHEKVDPTVYQDRKLHFLTGPCPRGRYQAYASRRWLETLSPDARQHVSCLCILVQPYEEDCTEETTCLAYTEFAEYLAQHVPALQTLHLHICPQGNNLCGAASEFSILLHSGNTKIVVVDHCSNGEIKEYGDSEAFLADMAAIAQRKISPSRASAAIQGEEAEGHQAAEGAELAVGEEEEEEEEEGGGGGGGEEHEEETKEGSVDDDWIDATMSPTSPQTATDKGWQLL